MSIYKSYDIRGIYPTELNEETAYKIGRAFVTFFKVKEVLVGRDVRLSGSKLHRALVKGITEQGAKVLDVGVLDTNSFYYAVYKLKAESGIMVTASHNPKEYNGFKFVRQKAIPVTDQNGILDIRNLVENNKFEEKKKGKVKLKKNIIKDFVKNNLALIEHKNIKELKVVVDYGNGAGAIAGKELFKKLKCKFFAINYRIDGNFPGRGANPWVNYKTISKIVKEKKADIGITFDGDGDRVFFIDELGKLVSGDFITALLAKNILKKKPEASIVYDLRSSRYVKSTIEAHNGKPLICRVGHSFIKQLMRNNKAVFAGEMSGHYYFKIEDLYCENSFLAALMILELIKEENKSLSELLENTQNYFLSGEINSKVKDKEFILRKLEMKYRDGKLNRLDGITIEYEDWWFNVRPSNTEPLIRLNLEANSKELMEKKTKEVLKVIRS